MVTINSLHNLYAGERCFILGNGPSLVHSPFDLLDREYTFAMNRIALIYPKTAWRQSFTVTATTAMDTPKFEDMRDDIIYSMGQSKKFNFIWDRYKDCAWAQDEKAVLINFRHADYSLNEAEKSWFSEDASQWVSKFGTSAFSAVQIAYYLGFSTIYLVGMDGYNSYRIGDPDTNHFTLSYMGDRYYQDYNDINTGMRMAQEFSLAASKKLGFEIYDATAAPGYGALEKVDLWKILQQD